MNITQGVNSTFFDETQNANFASQTAMWNRLFGGEKRGMDGQFVVAQIQLRRLRRLDRAFDLRANDDVKSSLRM